MRSDELGSAAFVEQSSSVRRSKENAKRRVSIAILFTPVLAKSLGSHGLDSSILTEALGHRSKMVHAVCTAKIKEHRSRSSHATATCGSTDESHGV